MDGMTIALPPNNQMTIDTPRQRIDVRRCPVLRNCLGKFVYAGEGGVRNDFGHTVQLSLMEACECKIRIENRPA